MDTNDYSTFLATRLIHEGTPITFRLLSRQFRVHNSLAKQCLYAFHDCAKELYPNKVHATYLISGVRREIREPREDVLMSEVSSPLGTLPDSSQDPAVYTSTFTYELVKEKDLDEARSAFERIDAVHVYSLHPSGLENDIMMLADCGRQVRDLDLNKDANEISSLYGVIKNPTAKRNKSRSVSMSVQESKPMEKRASSSSSNPKSATPAISSIPTFKAHNVIERNNTSKSSALSSPFQNALKTHKPKSSVESEAFGNEKSVAFANEDVESKEERQEPVVVKVKKPMPVVKPAVLSPELMSMFSDDETQAKEDVEMKNIDRVGDPEQTEREIKVTSGFVEDNIEVNIDNSAPTDAETKGEDIEIENTTAEEQEVLKQPLRKRGRRKVERTVNTQDADGYIVTKYVTEWESYSESSDVEEAAIPTKAPQQKRTILFNSNAVQDKPVKKEKKKSGSGQSSLMNFIKK
ncbi:DNA polymerase subunit Cdc27 [Lipomyces arxii]|uniref:DNA polymerase subunit Cdc27 n=1 Tax=Lipomyces arxii TaxID=56418 RepID=UPI0034CF9CAC